MKLCLFIGHHKVGSSALQTYLGRNAVALLRHDVLYPAVEGQGLATLLAMALNSPGGNGPDWPAELAQPINLREAHNALAFAMMAEHRGTAVNPLHQGLPPVKSMLKIVERQIEVLDPQVTILAAEVFSNFGGLSPKLIRKLYRTFPDADLTLTATFRRVDDYLASWHGQRLRFGDRMFALPGALSRYTKTIHFNYRTLLSPWIKARPEAALRIRNYDDVVAAGGSVQDFLTGFDLPAPEDPAAMPRVNESLHRAFFEIMRQANKALEKADAQEMFGALMALAGEADLPPNRDVELFGAKAREAMARDFAPIHDWLGKTTGQDAFFPDAEKIGTLCPVPEIEAARAALSALQGPLSAELPRAARTFISGLDLEPNYS